MTAVRGDIQQFLNVHKFSSFQWMVFALCFCTIFLDGFNSAAASYIAPSLIAEWGAKKENLTLVFNITLLGLAVGTFSSGPLSDRFGRKPLVIISVFLFGASSLFSYFAYDLRSLCVLRFVTGLGLGAAMPLVVAIIHEISPFDRRSLVTSAMFCGFPIGVATGGYVSLMVIPLLGWKSIFLVGGIMPMLILPALMFMMPESIFYLAERKNLDEVRAILLRISPDAAEFTLSPATAKLKLNPARTGLALVLSPINLLGSVALWLTYFMGLVIFYGIVNWMPLLFQEIGLSAQSAARLTALFPAGGFGAVLTGWLMDKYNSNWILCLCFGISAAIIYLIGALSGSVPDLMVLIFIAGFLTGSAQCSLPALAAAFYPTAGRVTGIAWMLGVGRFGGIAGSILVASLFEQHMPFSYILSMIAIPALIASAALAIKQGLYPENKHGF